MKSSREKELRNVTVAPSVDFWPTVHIAWSAQTIHHQTSLPTSLFPPNEPSISYGRWEIGNCSRKSFYNKIGLQLLDFISIGSTSALNLNSLINGTNQGYANRICACTKGQCMWMYKEERKGWKCSSGSHGLLLGIQMCLHQFNFHESQKDSY